MDILLFLSAIPWSLFTFLTFSHSFIFLIRKLFFSSFWRNLLQDFLMTGISFHSLHNFLSKFSLLLAACTIFDRQSHLEKALVENFTMIHIEVANKIENCLERAPMLQFDGSLLSRQSGSSLELSRVERKIWI